MPQDSLSHISASVCINGELIEVTVPPEERLVDTLRYRLALTGTKEGCGEGECGACTILLDDLPVFSCLVPTFQVRNRNVRTIESVKAEDVGVMLECGTTQCGACSPGIVMMAYWISKNRCILGSNHYVAHFISGNLCRCTGYRGVIEGVENSLNIHVSEDDVP